MIAFKDNKACALELRPPIHKDGNGYLLPLKAADIKDQRLTVEMLDI